MWKKFLLSALALLFVAAANTQLCCSLWVDGQALPPEQRLELGPLVGAPLHRRDALEARVSGETRLHHLEVFRVVRRELQPSPDLQALPERVQEERAE